jgi:hypothetical protein
LTLTSFGQSRETGPIGFAPDKLAKITPVSLESQLEEVNDMAVGTRVSARTGAPSAWRSFFSFPDPVNEVSARLVAGGVMIMAVGALIVDEHAEWLLFVLAYGFIARVLTGPTMSPLGQLVTRVITPRAGFADKPVPGPPKRFAQAIGVLFSVSALVVTLAGEDLAARAVLALLVIAATLESVFALCLGCKVFALLMRVGIVPEAVCERCNNVSLAAG